MYKYLFLTAPTAHEVSQVLALYSAAGWWDAGDSARPIAEKIVQGSHCFLTVRYEGDIVGMARAISDGVSDAYVQDVTVLAAHRGKGLAKALVTKIVTRLHEDGIDWIGLIAERNTAGLYRRIGFKPMCDAMPMLMRS